MQGQRQSRRAASRRLRATLLLIPALVVPTGRARSETAPPCEDSDAVAVFSSPRVPQPGAVLRVVAVAERKLAATLVVLDPEGQPVAATNERHGGPPYSWRVEVEPGAPGSYRAILRNASRQAACRTIDVGLATDGSREGAPGVWPVTRDWSRATENLFSAWIEQLFDDPLDAEPAWRGLHEVTRDPERNFLHDHLGLGEDGEHGLRLEPDCADLPYFLRAYFAWKLGLPFGYSDCSRGDDGKPPRCGRWHSNLEASPVRGSPVERMQQFLAHDVADTAQSGAGRAPGKDDRTDFYPTRLSRATLRPGTVYADPYGHTLVVVRWVPQTATAGGLLLAVDAQPDKTVARKRYWRGNFLFAHDPALGSPGFKHFRPIVRADDGLRPLDNDEIRHDPDYGDFDLQQDAFGIEAFYDRVDGILSPWLQDPTRVLHETIDALEEEVRARVRSVANGEEYVAKHPEVIAMPDGAAIFETDGPWEDYATPSRDLRLLIAIDVVRAFPQKVASRPERFVLPPGIPADQVRAALEAQLERELSSRHVDYTRSDGSPWRLSLADVIGRAQELEMAYNPNDCVEVRWGAAAPSAEVAPCRRHAPAEQAERMRQVREWFGNRRRPPR